MECADLCHVNRNYASIRGLALALNHRFFMLGRNNGIQAHQGGYRVNHENTLIDRGEKIDEKVAVYCLWFYL